MSEKYLDSIFSTLHLAPILFPSCLCRSPNRSLEICKSFCKSLDFSTLQNHICSLSLSDSQSICLPQLIIISQTLLGKKGGGLLVTNASHSPASGSACLLAQSYTFPAWGEGGDQMTSQQGSFSKNQSQRKGPGIWSPSKESQFPGPHRTLCVTLGQVASASPSLS